MSDTLSRSKERLYIVLNEQFNPPKQFANRTIKFQEPTVVDLHGRNTLVTIEGIPGRGYYGDVDVYYDRLALSDVVEPFIFRTLDSITEASLASAIANKTGVDVTAADLATIDLPALQDGESTTVTVTASSRSLQWTGSLEMTVEYGKAWLDTVIGRTSLGTLAHPNPNPRRMYGRMLGWNTDFTGALEYLKVDKRGKYTDWRKIRYLTALLGWPSWGENPITDLATSQVPDSNPAFARVVVQQHVNSSQVVGPIYFHYNPIQGYK